MAKAVGLGSMFRGKLGNMVGYLTRNRAGRYEQSVKAYQPVVANPQTMTQAMARIPLGPVQRFYNQFSTIISRGWEGVAYGDTTKNEYLSYNLKNFTGPYLVKGDLTPYPGSFLMSKGSLANIGIKKLWSNSPYMLITTDMVINSDPDVDTMGDWWKFLITKSALVQSGEQWTICYCYEQNGQMMYGYFSLYVDPFDDTYNEIFQTHTIDGTVYLCLGLEPTQQENTFYGATIIRSAAFGTTGYRRSTTFFQLNPDVYQHNDVEALKAAVLSYRDDPSDTDWETDPTPEYQQIAYKVMVPVTNDMITGYTVEQLGNFSCMGYVTKGGDVGIFYAYDNANSQWRLLDGYGKFLVVVKNSSTYSIRYNETYQPAIVWRPEYGTIY